MGGIWPTVQQPRSEAHEVPPGRGYLRLNDPARSPAYHEKISRYSKIAVGELHTGLPELSTVGFQERLAGLKAELAKLCRGADMSGAVSRPA
jgi:hypothetical protein